MRKSVEGGQERTEEEAVRRRRKGAVRDGIDHQQVTQVGECNALSRNAASGKSLRSNTGASTIPPLSTWPLERGRRRERERERERDLPVI